MLLKPLAFSSDELPEDSTGIINHGSEIGLSVSRARSNNFLLTQRSSSGDACSRGNLLSTRDSTVSDLPPILLVEPLQHPRKEQQRMCELLFETFKVPAVSAIKSASAGVFANGRTTGLALTLDTLGQRLSLLRMDLRTRRSYLVPSSVVQF